MSDWTVADLQKWDDKICREGEDFGLDWFPIDYEIIDYQEMLGIFTHFIAVMVKTGLPTTKSALICSKKLRKLAS